MTATPVSTAAASVVALPNAWDDAEEWEPTAQTSSARVVPFPNADVPTAAAHAPTVRRAARPRNEGSKRLGDLCIGRFAVCAAAALAVVVFGHRILGEPISPRTKTRSPRSR